MAPRDRRPSCCGAGARTPPPFPLWLSLLLAFAVSVPALASPHHRALTTDPSGTQFEVLIRDQSVLIRDLSGAIVWDDFNPSLRPWSIDSGRFATHNVVLIGVRKVCVFDPVVRPRPFIYRLAPGGRGLIPVWLGTSLSRPYIRACFADLDARGEDELIALERTRAGALQLAAYRWRGFGIEGIARSEDFHGASELQCADMPVILLEEPLVWRFVAFSLEGEALRPVAFAAANISGGPRPSWRAIPGAIELSRRGVTRAIRLHPAPEHR